MNNGLYGNPNPRRRFISAQFPLAAGIVANVPHGLPGVPEARWVLVCLVAENGYQVGDTKSVHELEIGNDNNSAFAVRTTRTQVQLTMNSGGTLYGITASAGTENSYTPANWRAQCIADYNP